MKVTDLLIDILKSIKEILSPSLLVLTLVVSVRILVYAIIEVAKAANEYGVLVISFAVFMCIIVILILYFVVTTTLQIKSQNNRKE